MKINKTTAKKEKGKEKEKSIHELVKKIRNSYTDFNVGTATLIISEGKQKEEVVVIFDTDNNLRKVIDKDGQYVDKESVKAMNKGSLVFNKKTVEIFYGSPKK